GVRPGRDVVSHAVPVTHRERIDGADLELRRPRGEQHAHLATRRSELGAREVVGEDLGVREAVLGVAVGAVLAHPDPVAPAGAGAPGGRVGAWGCERARRSERGCAGGGDDEKECERSTHRRAPDPRQPTPGTRRGYQTGPESRNFLYGIVTLDLTGEEK